MSKQNRGLAAWITLVVAAMLCLAAAVLLVVQLVRPDQYRIASREQAAMDAAAQEMVNNATLSRKTFDADWDRAMKGTSGATHDSLSELKAQTLASLNEQKVDLTAQVTSVAVKSSNKNSVIVLVSFNGYTVGDDGKKTINSTPQMELTMKQTGGKWLIDDTQSMGLDS